MGVLGGATGEAHTAPTRTQTIWVHGVHRAPPSSSILRSALQIQATTIGAALSNERLEPRSGGVTGRRAKWSFQHPHQRFNATPLEILLPRYSEIRRIVRSSSRPATLPRARRVSASFIACCPVCRLGSDSRNTCDKRSPSQAERIREAPHDVLYAAASFEDRRMTPPRIACSACSNRARGRSSTPATIERFFARSS
jgi:hypothetical protein